jgi:hypothetical protein
VQGANQANESKIRELEESLDQLREKEITYVETIRILKTQVED